MTKQEKGERTCGGCRYFDRVRDTKEGSCCRYPPQPHVYSHWDRGIEETSIVTIYCFPELEDDNWCGEWAAADDRPLEDVAREVLG